MCKCNGFEIQEILLINHGGPHNDTIVVVDKFGIIQLIRVGFSKDEEDLVGDLSETIDRLLLD